MLEKEGVQVKERDTDTTRSKALPVEAAAEMDMMQVMPEDDLFDHELHRLVNENTHLRQHAWCLTVDMRQLQLLARTPCHDSGFEMDAEVSWTNSFPESPQDLQYSDYLLKLANENDSLRKKIQKAEVEIFQMELAIESKMHSDSSDDEMEEDFRAFGNVPSIGRLGGSRLPKLAPPFKKIDLDLLDNTSESSESGIPRIKAVFNDTRNAQEAIGRKRSLIPRHRAKSNESTESWSSVKTRITCVSSIPRVHQQTSVRDMPVSRRIKKGSTSFMGCRGSVNVDSASSAFFASLRS